MQSSYHIPVLLSRSVDALVQNPDGTYVDLTFGGGGHSKAILNKLSPVGKLYSFDQDSDAHKNAASISDDRFILIQHNFYYVKQFLQYFKALPVDGILGDLGISSHQIDVPHRGFAHRTDGPLDMRMNNKAKKSAADILNQYEEEELANVLYNYGELKNSRKIAAVLVKERKAKRIETTFQLCKLLSPLTSEKEKNKFYSQVFQALRIEVNQELKALEKVLIESELLIKTGGTLVMISYHSLEDRLVKNYLKTGTVYGAKESDFFGATHLPFAAKSSAELPDSVEISENPRARSAKMRIGVRTQWKQKTAE